MVEEGYYCSTLFIICLGIVSSTLQSISTIRFGFCSFKGAIVVRVVPANNSLVASYVQRGKSIVRLRASKYLHLSICRFFSVTSSANADQAGRLTDVGLHGINALHANFWVEEKENVGKAKAGWLRQ